MAEISQGQGRTKGKTTRSRTSTKIDMTPMVDLAFLLITFFMLTTSFSTPKTMEVLMPDKDDSKPTQLVAESGTITFILGKDDKAYWFLRTNTPETNLQEVSMRETTAVRKIIVEQTQRVWQARQKGLVIIIKSLDNAKYQNLVDMLDEMHITNQQQYALVDLYAADKALLAAKFPNSL
jgi:biopolymer transport protein ExbD